MQDHIPVSGSPDEAPIGTVSPEAGAATPAQMDESGSPPDEPVVEHRLQFTGSGSEYFRIWIVNLFLSILTLGIYSAWAKVRREQYFHRNTLLDGSGFDYHGNPKAILRGRLIAVALLFILAGIDKAAHDLYYPALLLATPLIPWLLIRSFVFRARNTSFRGLHFNFVGTYKGFCKAFLGYVLALLVLGWGMTYSAEHMFDSYKPSEATSALSTEYGDDGDPAHAWADEDADEEAEAGEKAGADKKTPPPLREMNVYGMALLLMLPWMLLLTPAMVRSFKLFQFNHLAFGASRFRTACSRASFYGISLRAALPSLITTGMLVFASRAIKSAPPAAAVPFVLLFLLFYAALLLAQPYWQALMANLLWNNTRLDRHAFTSDQTFWGIAGVVLTNWLLMLLTLGLYWPWAKVRLAAYRIGHATVRVAGNLDTFVAGATQEQNAIGEEIADIFDFDLAL